MNVRKENQLRNKILAKPVISNTGFRGISLRKNGKYESQFCILGQKVHIGTFNTLEAARLARIEFIDNLK